MAEIPTTPVFQKGSVSLPPTIIFLTLYSFACIYITYLTFFRYKTWYITVIPLGAFIEVIGYAVRIYSVNNKEDTVAFIVTLSLPLLLAAGDYILLGRLISHALPPSQQKVLKIPGRYITHLFVGLDVVAAAIQGAGTTITAGEDWTGTQALTGVHVLVAGLAVQVAGVGLFVVVLGRFSVLVNSRRLLGVVVVVEEEKEEEEGGWKGLAGAVWVSSLLILIRCIYRLAEFVEGIDGYAFKNEWLFWVFEGTAMLVSILVFCVWHPGACLKKGGKKGDGASETQLVQV